MFHYTDAVNSMGKMGLHSVFWQQSTLYSYRHKRNVLWDLPGGEMVVCSPSECNLTQISA